MERISTLHLILDVQRQLAGMISAEQELEGHLHAAHVHIEQQLVAMRAEVRTL